MTHEIKSVRDAEYQIAMILAEVEKQTDSLINSVTIHDVAITDMQDSRPQRIRQVKIELDYRPGSHWQGAGIPS